MSDMEGKAVTGSGEQAGTRASFNGANGTRDMEGKVARVEASKPGSKRVSKNSRHRGKAKVDLQSLVLRRPPRLESEWHLGLCK
jgi:hypothetical protein